MEMKKMNTYRDGDGDDNTVGSANTVPQKKCTENEP